MTPYVVVLAALLCSNATPASASAIEKCEGSVVETCEICWATDGAATTCGIEHNARLGTLAPALCLPLLWCLGRRNKAAAAGGRLA